MSVDVAGYSKMMAADEAGTLQRLKKARSAVLDPAVAEFHGRIVKTLGDGFLCEFSSAVDAVQCAMEIQDRLAAPSSEPAKPLPLRIGINLGDIIVEGDDIFGDGVNVAARIEALAAPGGICISGTTFDQVDGKIGATFASMGEQTVKNIDKPIRVYAYKRVETDQSPGSVRFPRDIASRPVIAVLPFENISGDREDDYFADGLSEDIITALSRFRELAVVARNSTFRFKGRAVDIQEIGRELGASYIVEGSVRRSSSRLRITAQLIRTLDGTHLWADRYDRQIEDIFDVQDEVTQRIAAASGIRLQDAARELSLHKNPADLNAYDRVLQSRRFTIEMTEVEHTRARDLLEEAIEIDPNYADAYALLGNVYLAELRYDLNPKPRALERAAAMIEKALEIDPQHAYAQCWSAITCYFRGDHDTFRAKADIALNLNPNDPEILAEIGAYLIFVGERERGAQLIEKAKILNPLHPGWYDVPLAKKLLFEGKFEEAIACAKRADLPNFYWSWLFQAAAYGHLGDKRLGREALDEVYRLKPGFSAATEFSRWLNDPEEEALIIEGLVKAGMTK